MKISRFFHAAWLAVCAFGAPAVSAQTVFTWANATNGSWTDPAAWDLNAAYPNNASTHVAVIDKTGAAYTVTAAGAAVGLKALTVNSADATVRFDFASSGSALQLGSAVSNLAAGLVEFRTGSGIYGGGTTATTLNIANGGELRFGTATGTRTLYNLTLNNSGTLHVTSGTLSVGNPTIVSNAAGALIHADGAELTLQSGMTLVNSGTLRATGSAGVLRFNNTVTTANLGAVDLVGGGRAILGSSSVVTNTASTLAAPAGGAYELMGGKISGGTIADGAVKFTTSGGTLDGAILADDLDLSVNGSRVEFTNVGNFTGTALTLGAGSNVYWRQVGTLTAKDIDFGTNSYVYITGENNALTLDADTRAEGDITIYSDGSAGTTIANAGTIVHTAPYNGAIYARSLSNTGTIDSLAGWLQIGSTTAGYTTTNSGTITADGTSSNDYGTVYLDGNVANTGNLVAEDYGRLIFRGTNSTENLGSVQIQTNGRVFLNGTLDNSAVNSVLTAPTGGKYELQGGTVLGGTVNADALTYTSSRGELSGVTIAGDFSLPAGTEVTFKNGTTFTGGNGTLGNNGGVYWQQPGTLAGKVLTFGAGSYLYVNGENNTLTLDSATTASGDISIYSSGSPGVAITNAGTLTHSSPNTSGAFYADTATNTGSITANTGWMQIGHTSGGDDTFNIGTITANGSSASDRGYIYLDGNVANTGTIVAQGYGVVQFRGTNSPSQFGTVEIGANAHAYLSGTYDNTLGDATLAKPTSGKFELLGGRIQGGTVEDGALTFTTSGGVLDGVTWDGNFTMPDSTYVYFENGTTFAGGSATFGSGSGIYWQQGGSLEGKALSFGSGSYIYLSAGARSLTLASSTSATGDVSIYTDSSAETAITNAGTLTHQSTSTGSLFARAFTNTGAISATMGTLNVGNSSSGYTTFNSGTITADGSSTTNHGTIHLDGDITNTGTIKAQNFGEIVFRGNNLASNLGTVEIGANGHVYLNGWLDNSAHTLGAPMGGKYELYNGTISGGHIAANALTFTSSAGTLSGVTIDGDVDFPVSGRAYFANDTGFSGPNLTLGTSAGLYWQQAETLEGKVLSFGNSSFLYVNGANTSITFDANSSATGDLAIYTDGNATASIRNEGTLTHTFGSGVMYARNLTNAASGLIAATGGTLTLGSSSIGYDTTNQGTIKADGSGTIVYLEKIDNSEGTLRAENGGTIAVSGSVTSDKLGAGAQILTGGHIYLDGTIDNTDGTISAPASGAYELRSGTIRRGTIANGAVTFSGYNGVLDGAHVDGDVAIPANAGVLFNNAAGFGGSALSLGTNARLYWNQNGMLMDKALTLASNALIYLTGEGSALTLNSGTTGNGDIYIVTDGSANTAFHNQGLLTHTNGQGEIRAELVTNTGTIRATGGTLYLGGSTADTAFENNMGGKLVVSASGNIVLQSPTAAPFTNLGSIEVEAGVLYTNGRLRNGAGGLLRGAGTINGGVTIAGGTIAPGNSGIGILTFTAGTLTVTDPAAFAVELGGTSADQIVFQNPGSNIEIGAGLLSLSLTLLSAPTADMTYNLIRIGSGVKTITGHFAGLPNSGDTLTAMFNSDVFTFAVNYQPQLISLTFTPVPEPQTYVLLAGGAGVLLVFLRRRRRGVGRRSSAVREVGR